ncbi:MAG: hypothetical protein EOO20_19710 [Chryseobacterium sp.]|nr:MAG: hypothetical protein EOO20_19710 [Chryseobacterium sp.]
MISRNLPFIEITGLKDICEAVSNLGRLLSGDVASKIEHDSDIYCIINLIEQASSHQDDQALSNSKLKEKAIDLEQKITHMSTTTYLATNTQKTVTINKNGEIELKWIASSEPLSNQQ